MTDWKQDEIEESVFDDNPHVCRHGVSFDEPCEECEYERTVAEAEDLADPLGGGA